MDLNTGGVIRAAKGVTNPTMITNKIMVSKVSGNNVIQGHCGNKVMTSCLNRGLWVMASSSSSHLKTDYLLLLPLLP
jgi:hypothetical protein